MKDSSRIDDNSELNKKTLNRAIRYACHLLGSREYSCKSMKSKLLSKSYSQEVAEQALSFLLDNDLISDTRFCESFIKSKSNRGQGLSRIKYELNQSGIAGNIVESVLDSMEICWQNICDITCEKKIRSANIMNDIKGRQKIERFLRYRGFSSSEIRHAIEQNKNRMGVVPSEYDE